MPLWNNIHIADTIFKDFEKALKSEMPDIEDAYQCYTTIKIRGLRYFITRNIKLYKKVSVFAHISIVTPEEFIKHSQNKK